MSDQITDPAEYLYQQTLELIQKQKDLRSWIDLMKDAGENTSSLEVTWNNNQEKIKRWKTALAARGKTF